MGHTEGKWIIDDNNIRSEKTDELIACAYGFVQKKGGIKYTKETFANANLIASAPELLEACKVALYLMKDTGREEQCMRLQQAINKAEGKE